MPLQWGTEENMDVCVKSVLQYGKCQLSDPECSLRKFLWSEIFLELTESEKKR